MRKIIVLLFFSVAFMRCPSPPNNPNTEFTINKRDAEEKIYQVTFVKVLSCNLMVDQAFLIGPLGNDEDPNPDTKNKSILYEKRAVNHCLKSILSIPCPSFPPNTQQAINAMVINVVSNRSLNCLFKEVRFFYFDRPLSGSFW